jgi:catechol-2,3-dioxygenase
VPVSRLNHAVLYVRDADRSAAFYSEVLGFRTVMSMPGGVFLQAPASSNDHDLALFSIGAAAGPSEAGRRTVGLYHLAWEVETLDDLDRLSEELSARGALVGASDHGSTKALYARDADGIEFEVSWLVPAALLDEEAVAGRETIRPLDIEREKQRYGAHTRGGIGVSSPAPVQA